MSNDSVLDMMKKEGIPMTRENYLSLAYFGNPPDELDPEEEFALPAQFQLEPPEEFD